MTEQHPLPPGPARARRTVAAWRRAVHAGLALCVVAAWSCSDLTRDGRAASFLIVNSLMARSGATDAGEFRTGLNSDVITFAGDPPRATVFEDIGQVTFTIALRDPGAPTSPTAATTTNFITVTRYRVEYRRTDGRNTPGVDVPHPFEGGLTVTVADPTIAIFTLVRATAKVEPPLAGLAENLNVIHTVADVTFYGHDQAGTAVTATGHIDVNFGNWPDPD